MSSMNTRDQELLELAKNQPVEVSIKEVEQMVMGFPAVSTAPFDWSSIINLNNILMTTVGAFIIAGSMILYTADQEFSTQTEQASPNPIAAMAMLDSSHQGTEDSPELSLEESPNPEPMSLDCMPIGSDDEQISPEAEPAQSGASETSELAMASISPAEGAEDGDLALLETNPELDVEPEIELDAEPDTNFDIDLDLKSRMSELPDESSEHEQSEAQPQEANDAQKREFEVGAFEGVSLAGSFDMVISQGDEHKVWAEGSDSKLNKLKVEVKGNTLKVWLSGKNKENYSSRGSCDDKSSRKSFTVYVQMPSFQKLAVAGSGDMTVESFKNLKDVDLDIAGSGSMRVNGHLEMDGDLDCDIAGSGDMNIDGDANEVSIDIAGSGDFKGLDLRVKEAEISIAGSGDVSIHAEEELSVNIAGSGDVEYVGEPNIKQRINGSGSISRN